MFAKHLGVQGGPLSTFLKWKAIGRANPNPRKQPGAASNVYYKAYEFFEVRVVVVAVVVGGGGGSRVYRRSVGWKERVGGLVVLEQQHYIARVQVRGSRAARVFGSQCVAGRVPSQSVEPRTHARTHSHPPTHEAPRMRLRDAYCARAATVALLRAPVYVSASAVALRKQLRILQGKPKTAARISNEALCGPNGFALCHDNGSRWVLMARSL
jgi:hypothetical protein